MTANAVTQPEPVWAEKIPASLVLEGTTLQTAFPWRQYDEVRKQFHRLLVDELVAEFLLFLQQCPTISKISLLLDPTHEYNDQGGTYLCWHPCLSVELTGPINQEIQVNGSTIDLSGVEDEHQFDEATVDWRENHIFDEQCEAVNALRGESFEVKRTDVEHLLNQPKIDLGELRAVLGYA